MAYPGGGQTGRPAMVPSPLTSPPGSEATSPDRGARPSPSGSEAVGEIVLQEQITGRKRLSLGVCCMASKAASAPMQAILRRLEMCGDFQTVVFSEEVIFGKPPEEWPVVDCLIAFFSTGFPLQKCIEYCRIRRPCCINNVEAQARLNSRVAVYRTLQEWCIPCPDHVVVDHLAIGPDSPDLVENENFIIFRGKKISKPFVEKPEDGDRHDIWIYYPRSIGGGAKKLFRKIKNQSSDFDPNQNVIRRDGTYLYEPFLPTQGTDIKVYTVGAGYVHAEARKAPTVDGKVNRSKDGKEVRYPVVLTQGEKAIAAFIVKAFRQNICGFDILRTDGGSYVCDVNGWSFVKGNQKYYNDCSTLIRKHLLDECGVAGVDTSTMMILGPGDEQISSIGAELSHDDYSMRESVVNRSPERLRSVIVVMRHGDRRPKEKMKFKTKMAPILSYFDKAPRGTEEVKLKNPEEMAALKLRFDESAADLREQLLQLETNAALAAPEEGKKFDEKRQAIREELANIDLLIPVLEMKDRFSGLERKVQLKATKWKQQKDAKDAKDAKDVDEESTRRAAQVQVVAKWGGELTVSGLSQAKELGRRLRHDLYPNDPTGLLRLHSSFRHDFKIYSSQEGRCQITAAAFTKGFLDLDGDIIPILVSLVTRESYAQGLLDEPIPKKQRDAVKQKIENLLLSYDDLGADEVLKYASPTAHAGLREAARRIGSPLQLLHTIRYLAAEYIESIVAAKDKTYEEMRKHHHDESQEEDDEHADCQDDAVPLGNQVPLGPVAQIPEDLKDSFQRKWLHLRRKENRWRKLFSGFVRMKDEEKGLIDENVTYDASKIPDVWDNLYYDMLTHRQYLGETSCKIAEMMVGLIHPLNEWVCLSEYGLSMEEKLRIGVDVTWRLIGKMLNDLEFMIEDDVGTIDPAGRHSADKGVPRTLSGVSTSSRRPGAGGLTTRSLAAEAPPELAAEPATSAGSNGSPLPSSCPDAASPAVASPRDTPSPSRRNSSSAGGCPASKAREQDGNASPADSAEVPREWKEWGTAETPADGGTDVTPKPDTGELEIFPAGRLEGESLLAGAAGDKLEEDSVPCLLPGGSSAGEWTDIGGDRKRISKGLSTTKLTPEVRNELKKALRDSSDWHPRLNDQVAKLTDIKNTRIVRSRIYVTSASTMHSLFNILRHGQTATDDEEVVSDLGNVLDLNYLTHLVLRCYERDAPKDSANKGEHEEDLSQMSPAERLKQMGKARYRVEVSMSPGVQVFKNKEHVQWPKGSELNENNCMVAPLQIIGESIDLARFEKFLAGAVKEYGPRHEDDDDDQDDERPSGDGD